MKPSAVIAVLAAIGLASAIAACPPAQAQNDVENSQDHPLVGRYEGSYISKYAQRGYEELVLPVKPVTRDNKDDPGDYGQALAGKLTRITYDGPPERSALEVVRNYQQKLEGDGFETVFACRRDECGQAAEFWSAGAPEGALYTNWDKNTYAILRKTAPTGDVWVSMLAVEYGGSGSRPLTPQIALNVVEVQPIETDKIVVHDASAIETAIANEGRIALYGIYFDFDKAVVKPDSEPQMREIAKLLNDRPKLNVLVVGHTDAKGARDYNRDLSRRRAEAVVEELVSKYGIDGSRLAPVGVGMAAPVASNTSEDGRAKNRRVEIVGRL